MPSKRRHEGYLLVDNSAAPGLSLEEIARTGKNIADVAGAGARGKFESGVVTCCHCQAQVLVNPMRTRDRGHCRKCDRYVCDRPACNAGCLPVVKVFDTAFAAAEKGNDQVVWAIRKLREDILF